MTANIGLELSELSSATGPILEYVISRSPLGMCVVDPSLRYRYVNDSLCSMLGYSRDELIGRTFLEITYPDDRDLDRNLSERVFRGEIPDFRIRKRFVRRDGSLITGDMQATVIRGDDGVVVWGIATIDNVSARDELMQKVADFERDSTLSSMAANIAHDLGNLLTIVKMRTEALAAGHPPHQTEQLQDALVRAEALTRGLLTFARQRPPARRVVDLDQLVAHFAGFAESLIPPHVRFRLSTEADGASVMVDPFDMERVLMNLVVNACDAMPDGGLLRLTTRRTTPEERADGYVAISVEDEGVGIPDRIRGRVFDPFFSTKGDAGSGVGLSIVKEIVEANGGFVRVESEPNEGTRFDVVLPNTEPEPTKQGI